MFFNRHSTFNVQFPNSKVSKPSKQNLLFIFGLSFFFTGIALGEGNHSDHGSAKVSFSVEDNKTKVIIEISSEDAYGMEKAPALPEEKKKAQEAVDKVSQNISSMIVFDPTLNCTWQQKSLEPWKTHDGNAKNTHGELHGEWEVTCKTKLENSRVKFGMKKVFPAINSAEITVNKGSKILKNTIKRDRGTITL